MKEMSVIVNNQKIDVPIFWAQSFFERFKGLMFQKEISYGLIFSNPGSLHTSFMFKPIDVLFWDKNKKVIKVIEGMKPWRISSYQLKAKAALELPNGSLRKYGIKVGSLLEVSDV